MSYDLPQIPDFDIEAIERLAIQYFLSQGFGGGSVMGKLGAFPFFMHKNEFKKITKTLNAQFSRYKPIKGQTILGDSGGFDEDLTINGILVAEPVQSTTPLEWFLKMRKPLRFTTLVHDENVVIKSLTKTETLFSLHGRHRVQEYSLSLEVVYGSIV